MDQEKIGQFIKSIRLDNNLTQKELALRLGVTYQAVSKWENGKNVPDIAIMRQISKEFNVNIDEILDGEKKKTPKNYTLVILISLVIAILGIIILRGINHKDDFEFKTISSNCVDFKINGSAAYNKDKTSIYISNVEFCGKEDKNVYKEITCILFENEDNTKTMISSCDKINNTNLEHFLEDLNIKVDNYKSTCKKMTATTLSLEIKATDVDNKVITYTIPIKLSDDCK